MSNIIKLNSQIKYYEMEDKIICSGKDETIITILENKEVIYNDDHIPNFNYCDEHGYIYYKGKINGIGIGVFVPGSIILTIKRKLNGGEALSDKFSKALSEYFKSKNLGSVRQDNNDILVDDYKVASGGEIMVNGYNYLGYQISINQDIEAIREICNKKSVKPPKALSDWGITTKEIEKFCEEYWTNN